MEDIAFCDDMCKLARVLPNVPSNVIYNKLQALKDNPDRVKIILTEYFSSYKINNQNAYSDEIILINRMIPEWSTTEINNELFKYLKRPNRIQLALKSYFNAENILLKKSHDADNNSEQRKKIKHNKSMEYTCETKCQTESYNKAANKFQNNLLALNNTNVSLNKSGAELFVPD